MRITIFVYYLKIDDFLEVHKKNENCKIVTCFPIKNDVLKYILTIHKNTPGQVL